MTCWIVVCCKSAWWARVSLFRSSNAKILFFVVDATSCYTWCLLQQVFSCHHSNFDRRFFFCFLIDVWIVSLFTLFLSLRFLWFLCQIDWPQTNLSVLAELDKVKRQCSSLRRQYIRFLFLCIHTNVTHQLLATVSSSCWLCSIFAPWFAGITFSSLFRFSIFLLLQFIIYYCFISFDHLFWPFSVASSSF